MPDADSLMRDLGLPRRRLRVGNRVFKADQDRAVTILLTASTWFLSWVSGQIIDGQRAAFIEALGRSKSLIVTIQCSPKPRVRVYDADRVLVELVPSASRERPGPPKPPRTVRKDP
jgi:hypothetical protein